MKEKEWRHLEEEIIVEKTEKTDLEIDWGLIVDYRRILPNLT